MPVNTRELVEAMALLADEQGIRVAVKQSAKGAMLCGVACFAGGILMGPVGLALGGAAGGIAAMRLTSGTFRPVGEIILHDMTDDQRELLVQRINLAVAEIQPTDIALLLPLILNNQSIQQAVLKTVISFITNEMKMQIID